MAFFGDPVASESYVVGEATAQPFAAERSRVGKIGFCGRTTEQGTRMENAAGTRQEALQGRNYISNTDHIGKVMNGCHLEFWEFAHCTSEHCIGQTSQAQEAKVPYCSKE